ncbi:MAG: NTP transferase domain-containing protein [Spirochaeta sp.]|nr:NTP transferase domain-containing protein [Spirochaeta sp.]
MSRIAAIITAAGASTRMGGRQKKEFLDLDGQPMLARAIAPLAEYCHPLVVTLPAGQISSAAKLLKPYFNDLILIEGGRLRCESVYLALQRLESYSPDMVLIHDGARPWASSLLVKRIIEETRNHGACIPVVGVTEAPKLVNKEGFLVKNLERSETKVAQTPQGFLFPSILKAHSAASREQINYIDDAAVYSKHIGPVYTITGETENKKITFPEDLS